MHVNASIHLYVLHLLWRWTLAKFRHETHVLLVHLVPPCCRARTTSSLLLPVSCSTSLAVPGSVPHPPASPAHHIVGHVGLVLALPRLVIGGPAVGALGHPVLPQGAVQQGQLPQLHLPQLVAALRHLDSLLDHLPEGSFGCLHRRQESSDQANLILLTALFTESASGAVTYACKGSSSPGRG